ncbi:hypothetical protein [Amycolatopsis sp. YIM 10]|uniref:hypothetical protein n=1 Tax=Amycolatopsis sp. YIM 10 TaxID=2653857 RepID=UPI001883976F|nr:hypothetical protein [Amycolatopsis sp. YIM 10]
MSVLRDTAALIAGSLDKCAEAKALLEKAKAHLAAADREFATVTEGSLAQESADASTSYTRAGVDLTTLDDRRQHSGGNRREIRSHAFDRGRRKRCTAVQGGSKRGVEPTASSRCRGKDACLLAT